MRILRATVQRIGVLRATDKRIRRAVRVLAMQEAVVLMHHDSFIGGPSTLSANSTGAGAHFPPTPVPFSRYTGL